MPAGLLVCAAVTSLARSTLCGGDRWACVVPTRPRSNEYIEELTKLDAVKDNMIGAGQQAELAVELLRWAGCWLHPSPCRTAYQLADLADLAAMPTTA